LIRFEHVTKRYRDGTVAVDALDLEVPAGKTMVLVGPSGCGKTTSLRMINRLIDPTEGRILLDGRDVRQSNPAQLRRGIGYVIQQSGLFPHRTVEDNIATVPLLNGWRRGKARARAHDLLELVGLDPALARRYPYQLSGGQQQRVGVARALAADPPVLLMDEPFSAVDPLIRASLQDELVRLQTELRKTVVLVTHDIEEAIKVGDLVALYRPNGRLAQVDTPQRLLGMPADSYVSGFVGFDRGIRRLSFFRATGLDLRTEPIVGTEATVAKALDAARDAGQSWIFVTDKDGKPRGWLAAERLAALAERTPVGEVPTEGFGHAFTVETDSLRAALDAAVLSPAGQAIGLDSDGRVVGMLSYDQLRAAIQAAETAATGPDAELEPGRTRA
jgi:osmoprotectant transport system ATP-binding protein